MPDGARKMRVADATREAVRRCLVTGETAPRRELLRFVVGPGDEVMPDVLGTLPGRGLWLRARRDIVAAACARNHFARAARRPVATPAELPERVEALLAQRCVDILGLARRAGQAVSGFEKVRGWLGAGRAGVLVTASDGAPRASAKLGAAEHAPARIDVLRAAELARAFGRERVVHVAVAPGALAERLRLEAARLGGFRGGGGGSEKELAPRRVGTRQRAVEGR